MRALASSMRSVVERHHQGGERYGHIDGSPFVSGLKCARRLPQGRGSRDARLSRVMRASTADAARGGARAGFGRHFARKEGSSTKGMRRRRRGRRRCGPHGRAKLSEAGKEGDRRRESPVGSMSNPPSVRAARRHARRSSQEQEGETVRSIRCSGTCTHSRVRA